VLMSKFPSPSSPLINATVMASAGTGKTWLLVTRLVRLLLAGAAPDAILAITFTRKAAAEMQSRLAERLLNFASLEEEGLAERLREMGIEPDAAIMARARRLYESLLQNRQTIRTTTFHAFCQEILLRFPLEADVPPGFELIDNGASLATAAWASMLAEAGREPEGEIARALEHLLHYCGGLHGLQRALDAFLEHRGDWWAYTETADERYRFAVERLQQELDISPDIDPLQHFFCRQRMEELAEFAALLAKHPNKGNDQALEQLAWARHPDLPLPRRFAACQEAFLTKQNSPRARKASKAQAGKMGADGEMRFLALHEAISQELLATLDQIAAHETWYACAAWYRAGECLLEHYQRIKAEQRLLDFTDLEWRAYRLLTHSDNALWVQYKLDQRIDHLLVDEFQDTNPTQWRLLLPLLQEMAAGQGEKLRSVFLVGDAKQSIYRFRRAEPRLFQAAHDWLSEHLDALGFPLHISWRSAPAIMECINQIFGEHGPLAGSLRDFTHHDTHHHELWGGVTVLPLTEDLESNLESNVEEEETTGLRNPLRQPRVLPIDDRYQREGAQIALTICELIDSTTLIGPPRSARPLHFGDIMLLVRSRSHVGYYESALRDAGIPYIGAERGTLLESLEVSDMVALLEVLITPYNNLSLTTVLRSPLYDCSDDDLLLLAQQEKGNWYQRLLALRPSQPEQSPLARAAAQLEKWREFAGRLPIHDLLDRVFNEGNVLARYHAAFPEHLRSRAEANLIRFLELALEIDNGRYPSLSHFLDRLSELRENRNEAPDEAPVNGSSERVRIMTIHAAKGLEAPVVFLADSATTSSSDKPFRTLIDWPAHEARPQRFLLVGRQGQQPPLVRESLEREKLEEQRESANLLYVAITRARQLLYISGVKPRRTTELGWYGAVRRALDPLQESEPGMPAILHSNQMPETAITAQETSKNALQEVDPALSRPLTLQPLIHEIAPSYQTSAPAVPGQPTDEDGRLRGLVIHRLLQRLTDLSPAVWSGIFPSVAAEYGLSPNSASFREWRKECEALLQEPSLAMVFHPPAEVESFNEVPIIYTLNGLTVHGIIDRLLLFPDSVWVIDYKSHQSATAGTLDSLSAPYYRQLGYYGTGVKQLWPEKEVHTFLLFTRCAQLQELDVTCNEPLSV
jgi:ATP-dependent helicase/nuclease subunit A